MTLPSEGRKLNQNEVDSIENAVKEAGIQQIHPCLLYTSPSPRDYAASRMPSSA